MARYLEILANQRPFPFDTDTNNRHMFSVNFRGLAESPVDKFEEDLAKILTDAGIATVNVDTFIGSKREIPSGFGPYTTIIDTGGTIPDETHNGSLYERLSVQIVIRATVYTIARTRALAIWLAIHGTRNTTITS